MADNSLLGGNIAPLIILIAVLSMVIVYAISVSPAERENLLGTISYERALVNTVPGVITPIPATTYKLTHKLADVEVNFAPLSEPQALATQISVSHSLLSHRDAAFAVDINKTDFYSATLTFEVGAKEGSGELIVELNKATIFSGILPKGPVTVPLPTMSLKDGTNNIVISTTSSGFESTTYALKQVNYVERSYSPEKAKAVQTFTLETNELQGMISARFVGLAKKLGQQAALTLSLNNNTIYDADISEDASLDMDLPISFLQSQNTMTWNVTKGGDYQILFGEVLTEYSKSPMKIKSYNFAVTDIEKTAIGSGLLVCNLNITAAEQIDQPLIVQVNAYKLNLNLVNGALTQDVCGYLQPGDNVLSVKSTMPVELSALQLKLTGKAYGV